MRKIALILSLLILSTSLALAQGKWRKFHSPEIGPGPRSGHGMVIDEARQKIVFFGGVYYEEGVVNWHDRFLGDTWEFDLRSLAWEKKEPQRSPRERSNFAITYHPVRKTVMIHGGQQPRSKNDTCFGGKCSFSPSTWEWDGRNWKLLDTKGPRRSRNSMVWNEANEELILFGGFYAAGFPSEPIYSAGTWEFKDGRWGDLTPQHTPRARSGAILVYDKSKERVLMHGGEQGSDNYLKDTVSWDGKNWIAISDGGAGYRGYHAAAYDSDRHILVMFGGKLSAPYAKKNWEGKWFNDTWEFENDEWKRIKTSDSDPSPRSSHAMVYDSLNKRVWLFGGGKRATKAWETNYFGDLWYYTIHNEFDLKPLFRNVSPGNKLEYGKTARFVVRIHNTGFDESQGHKASLFLSKDDQLSDDDKLLIAKQFKRHIRPNSKADLKIAKKISKNIAPGKYYLIVKVITDKGIDLNKDNNIRVRTKPIEIIRNTIVPAQPDN